MARRKQIRKTVSTSLMVVGEGADDKAFIDHMKRFFCPRSCGRTAKVEAGDGGSAGNIIQNAIRSFKAADYDNAILCWILTFHRPMPKEKKQSKMATVLSSGHRNV